MQTSRVRARQADWRSWSRAAGAGIVAGSQAQRSTRTNCNRIGNKVYCNSYWQVACIVCTDYAEKRRRYADRHALKFSDNCAVRNRLTLQCNQVVRPDITADNLQQPDRHACRSIPDNTRAKAAHTTITFLQTERIQEACPKLRSYEHGYESDIR